MDRIEPAELSVLCSDTGKTGVAMVVRDVLNLLFTILPGSTKFSRLSEVRKTVQSG